MEGLSVQPSVWNVVQQEAAVQNAPAAWSPKRPWTQTLKQTLKILKQPVGDVGPSEMVCCGMHSHSHSPSETAGVKVRSSVPFEPMLDLRNDAGKF